MNTFEKNLENNRYKLEYYFYNIYCKNPSTTRYFDLLIDTIKKYEKVNYHSKYNNLNWIGSNNTVGMTMYVDLFADDFLSLIDKIDYLKDLGITYVHLMPLLKARTGESDGGYAVEDFRKVDSKLGNLREFKKMIKALHDNDIAVCIDYVINHVAKENVWAKKALKGEKKYQDMFIMFEDDVMPNIYNKYVMEVLPNKSPGNFTYYDEIDRYVYTSFSDFQWDLNYANPEVFIEMVDILLYLANLGIDIIRLDAIPFIWKIPYTNCRNLKENHDLLKLFHLVKDVCFPKCQLLGEAIVEPHEIVKYFGNGQRECEVMYNAILMVDIYNSFATKDIRLIRDDMYSYNLKDSDIFMNYLRCHDDIGWGFNEESIKSYGLNPEEHKQFLIQFYSGQYPNSFSSGEIYQYNPITNDARINGTLASLLGFELADNDYAMDYAIKRITMANALIISYKGIPLIYSSDEIATINDQSYLNDEMKKNEGRWVHRTKLDWNKITNIKNYPSENKVYTNLKKLILIRKQESLLDGYSSTQALDIHNDSVFSYRRFNDNEQIICIYNFSDCPQIVDLKCLQLILDKQYMTDLIQNKKINMYNNEYYIYPYEYLWLK